MKVVLFCGGQGMRMREYSQTVPKPLVPIGNRPIIWHLMKYYAHFGHKEFILCLGHRGEAFKEYFLNYKEWTSNDFTLHGGIEGSAPDSGRRLDDRLELMNRDIDDWTITFVDTGINACVGERLMAVRDYLDPDQPFLANYSDGLTDLPLPRLIEQFHGDGKAATFVCAHPSQSFHVVRFAEQGAERHAEQDVEHGGGHDTSVRPEQTQPVAGLEEMGRSNDMWINVGFFVFHPQVFDYMRPGEELVHEPFGRLAAAGQLTALPYEGFWTAMDTFKDWQRLEQMLNEGRACWQVWKEDGPAAQGDCEAERGVGSPNDRAAGPESSGGTSGTGQNSRRSVRAPVAWPATVHR